MKRTVLTVALVSAVCAPAVADDTLVLDLWRVEKVENQAEDWTDYTYTLDYQHDYGHTGPIFDWHVYLGNWTPGLITITPPENWAGTWQGGSYGCETNQNPYYFGNEYLGNWKIRVKWGYGDGTATYTFTDNLHNVVGYQPGVLVPTPEPASLSLLAIGGMLLLRRSRR